MDQCLNICNPSVSNEEAIRSTQGQKHSERRSLAERKRYVAFGGEAETGCGQNTDGINSVGRET